jgi:hypothetical protein
MKRTVLLGRPGEGRLDERDVKHALGKGKWVQNIIWKPVKGKGKVLPLQALSGLEGG